jgi:Flp pilus assembly protein TadB
MRRGLAAPPAGHGGCGGAAQRKRQKSGREGEGSGAVPGNTIYRGRMGMLILLVLAGIALFLILSAVISALHFLFWIAVVALLVFAGLRLASGARRRSRR